MLFKRPAATAIRCLPPAWYVITPPPTGCPVAIRRNTFPVAASNARIFPRRSPVTTSPLAVMVAPATSGAGDWYRQRTVPVSASTAVTQPLLRGSFSPKAFPNPRNCFPGSNSAPLSPSFSGLHQSTLLTSTRLVAAQYREQSNSTPPPAPG